MAQILGIYYIRITGTNLEIFNLVAHGKSRTNEDYGICVN